ncbi:MAG: hypothetical protein WBL67_21670 [Nitrososphaeraceae archaeon]
MQIRGRCTDCSPHLTISNIQLSDILLIIPVSSVNNCGNGDAPLNVWCKNRASQLLDGQNEVGLASNQGFSEAPPPNPNP